MIATPDDGAASAALPLPLPQEQQESEKAQRNGPPELDFQVGMWRGRWPAHITCIICVDTNHVVRYFSRQRLLDLAFFDPVEKAFVTVAEMHLGAHELPPLSSLHHFEVRGASHVIGIAEDGKRFVVLRLADQRFFFAASGALPHVATHLVIFKYRALHYALAYNSNGVGEYVVLALPPLVAGELQASIVSRGRFRAGWTDVVWKGTHHVRCTRQRFFCYCSRTGEVAFECVYVRGGSTSSSICSAEHTQMAAKESDHPLQATLKRKGCIAVPLQLGGRLVCLLYSHSSLMGPRAHDTSTSRLPVSSGYGMGASTNVAASASLLLEKKIFAHAEHWTHFCMLGAGALEGGGVSERLLCYSAGSGEVWVNRVFHSTAPVKEVTLLNDAAPTHGPDAAPHERHGKRGHRQHGGSGDEGADTDCLTSEALGRVGEAPLSVEHFASAMSHHHHYRDEQGGSGSATPAGTTRRRGGGSGADNAGSDGREREPRMNSARSRRSAGNATCTPLHPRPPSSSKALRDRLAGLKPTSDYHADITRVLQELSRLDFPANAPAVRLALEDVPQLAPDDDDDYLTGDSATASGRSKRRSARGGSATSQRPPWRSVSGLHDLSPPPTSSWLTKFERDWERHREEEVPQMALDTKKLMRLHKPPQSREEFQKRQLDAMYKALAAKMVGSNKNDPHNPVPPSDGRAVLRTVTRLGIDDVQVRERRRKQALAKYGFNPVECKKLESGGDEIELVKHLADDAVAQQKKRREALKKKYLSPPPTVPCAPPLSPEQQQQLAARLVDASLERQAASRERTFHEMTAKHQPPTLRHDQAEIELKATRLWRGESAEERQPSPGRAKQ